MLINDVRWKKLWNSKITSWAGLKLINILIKSSPNFDLELGTKWKYTYLITYSIRGWIPNS